MAVKEHLDMIEKKVVRRTSTPLFFWSEVEENIVVVFGELAEDIVGSGQLHHTHHARTAEVFLGELIGLLPVGVVNDHKAGVKLFSEALVAGVAYISELTYGGVVFQDQHLLGGVLSLHEHNKDFFFPCFDLS